MLQLIVIYLILCAFACAGFGIGFFYCKYLQNKEKDFEPLTWADYKDIWAQGYESAMSDTAKHSGRYPWKEVEG